MKNTTLLTSVAALALIASASALSGCAHSGENKKLDSALNAEKTPASSSDMRATADQEIRNSKALTEEEKTKILAIKAKLQADLEANKEESLKLRALFVKNLTSPTYDAKQVSLIKKRLKANSEDYTKILIKGLEDAAKAAGKATPEKSEMLNQEFGVRGSMERH